MNKRFIAKTIKENIDQIKPNRNFVPNSSPQTYKWSNLPELRLALHNLEQIPFIQKDIELIRAKSPIISSSSKDAIILSPDDTILNSLLSVLKTGLEFLLKWIETEDNFSTSDSLMIKLPELKSFDDLSRISNEFKKGIELPIADSKSGDEVKIVTAESGSIWLLVYVGAAINLIAAICWSAAVIRRKWAEGRMFEEHAKTLELKNDALDALVQAQNKQLQNILQAEADAIAAKYYSALDQDSIGRLKLSINSIADMIDRGAIVLPADNSNAELAKMFPDYSKLNLIESTIKQLNKAG